MWSQPKNIISSFNVPHVWTPVTLISPLHQQVSQLMNLNTGNTCHYDINVSRVVCPGDEATPSLQDQMRSARDKITNASRGGPGTTSGGNVSISGGSNCHYNVASSRFVCDSGSSVTTTHSSGGSGNGTSDCHYDMST